MTIEIYDSSIISKRTSVVKMTGKTIAGVCASKTKEHVALSSNIYGVIMGEEVEAI